MNKSFAHLRYFYGYCLLVLLLLCANTAWAQELVVVQSNMTTIPAGSMLKADEVLRLGRSDTLTVIARSGDMRVIKGPYRGTWVANNAKPVDNSTVKVAVSRLLATRSDDLSTLGTVRRVGASTVWLKPFASEGWNLISAEHDGVQCVLPGKPLRLIRQQTQVLEMAQLRAVSGAYQPVQWADNAQQLVWPESVPVTPGGVYLLRRNASSIPYRLEISELDSGFSEAAPVFQMAALIARQCVVQAALVQYAAGL